MSVELLKEIESKYEEAGFVVAKKLDNSIVFKNKFSVHYIFCFDELNEAYTKAEESLAYLENDYLKEDLITDLYWNFYAIFIVKAESSEAKFIELKKNIENNFRMSRKYVLSAKHIESLPPLFIKITGREHIKSESIWEKEWREAIGEKLYDSIVDSPKSHVENILKEYVNDKRNNNK